MIAALFLGELIAAEDALRAHVQCAEHGDLCHVDPATAAATSAGSGRAVARIDATPADAGGDGAEHDHCGIDHNAPPRLEQPPHVAAMLGRVESDAPPTSAPQLRGAPRALFRLAPKLSPPTS